MAQFIIVYLGGEQPANPDDAQQHMEKYRQWLTSLGDAVVSALNPLKDTHVVSAKGVTNGSSTAMSGFTIIQATYKKDTHYYTCKFLAVLFMLSQFVSYHSSTNYQ